MGLRENWVDGGCLTVPAYEYTTQAGEYGNLADRKDDYIDMFAGYLSKIPAIKEYVGLKKDASI